jgi:hypothetical protein
MTDLSFFYQADRDAFELTIGGVCYVLTEADAMELSHDIEDALGRRPYVREKLATRRREWTPDAGCLGDDDPLNRRSCRKATDHA